MVANLIDIITPVKHPACGRSAYDNGRFVMYVTEPWAVSP